MEIENYRYPIFKHLAENHNLILVDSEIDDIIDIINQMQDKAEIEAIMESTKNSDIEKSCLVGNSKHCFLSNKCEQCRFTTV